MQQAQVEEQRQKEANETALAAIGKPKKRKLEESTNYPHQPIITSSNGPEQISPIQPSPSSTNLNSKSVCFIYLNPKTKNQINGDNDSSVFFSFAASDFFLVIVMCLLLAHKIQNAPASFFNFSAFCCIFFNFWARSCFLISCCNSPAVIRPMSLV